MELLRNVSAHVGNNSLINNSSRCLYLKFKDNTSLSFCHVDAWEPRISEVAALASFIIVTVYSCFVTSSTMYYCGVGSKLKVLYRKLRAKQKAERLENNNEASAAKGCKACFYRLKRGIKEIFEITKIVFLPVFGMLWNCIDGALDAYTFYQLETGNLIDHAIQRNAHVNNAILAFAVLGATSNFLTIKLWAKFQNTNFESDAKKRFTLERYTMYIPFFFEDAAELILEYFYIQRYVSITPPYYLYVKDITIVLLLIYNVYNYLSNERDNFGASLINALYALNILTVLQSIGSLCVLVAQIIRLVGQWIQFVEGTVPSSCFVIKEGKVFQKPFKKHCLREFEIALLVLTSIPIIKCLLVAKTFFLFRKPKRRFKWKENVNGGEHERCKENTFDIPRILFNVMDQDNMDFSSGLATDLTKTAVTMAIDMTEEVEKQIVVDEQPTKTGPEYVDYMKTHSEGKPRDENQIFCCDIITGTDCSPAQICKLCCFFCTCCLCCQTNRWSKFLGDF